LPGPQGNLRRRDQLNKLDCVFDDITSVRDPDLRTSEEIVMIELQQKRRSFLVGMAGLGVSQVLLQGQTAAHAATTQGYVLGPDDGDHLVHFRNPGNIFIKVDPSRGSGSLAMGTQQVPVGAGIPIHRHFEADEAFYVLEGGGTFILNDQPHTFEKGGTIFIPKNTWHGFANPDRELLLLWIVTPTGLDGFFRETCNPPGASKRQLTKEQINEIARKYATEFR
jgi:quercetin dioxygenase-like cupin family protein